MTLRRLEFFALLVIVSACARSARAPEASAPATQTGAEAAPLPAAQEAPVPQLAQDGDYAQLLTHDRELAALTLGAADCGKACEHLAALCGLAERICGLALQEPDAELEAHCKDGRERCERARTRVQAACTCTP